VTNIKKAIRRNFYATPARLGEPVPTLFDGGATVFYSDANVELASLPFPEPAFFEDGDIWRTAGLSATISTSGKTDRAEMQTRDGRTILYLTVGTMDGNIVLNTTDFIRGGSCLPRRVLAGGHGGPQKQRRALRDDDPTSPPRPFRPAHLPRWAASAREAAFGAHGVLYHPGPDHVWAAVKQRQRS